MKHPVANRWGFSWNQFWQSLAAVLLGNALYFGLYKYLPPKAQHQPYHLDWGLAIDFWGCLAIYGLLARLKWFRRK